MRSLLSPNGLQRGTLLLSPALVARLTDRLTADHPDLPAGMPERILDQALAFLAAAAVTTEPIGPSDLVDIGLARPHPTRDYAVLCNQIAGRFVHHEPQDGSEWPTVPGSSPVPLSRAVGAITAAGYQVDLPLWRASADCTQCHVGCHDSPKN